MALRYYKSGSWTLTSSWSLTSGGVGGASVPGTADDVIWDSNSSGTCVTSSNLQCKSWTVTADCNAAGFQGGTSYGISVYGNVSLMKEGFFVTGCAIAVDGTCVFNKATTATIAKLTINKPTTILCDLTVPILIISTNLTADNIAINVTTTMTFSGTVPYTLNLTNCVFTSSAPAWSPVLNVTRINGSTSDFIFNNATVGGIKLSGNYKSIKVPTPNIAGLGLYDALPTDLIGTLEIGHPNAGLLNINMNATVKLKVGKLIANGTSSTPFAFTGTGVGASLFKEGTAEDEMSFCGFHNLLSNGYKLKDTCFYAGTSSGFLYDYESQPELPFSIRIIGEPTRIGVAATSFSLAIPVGAVAGDIVVVVVTTSTGTVSNFSANGYTKLNGTVNENIHVAFKLLTALETSLTLTTHTSLTLSYQVTVIKDCKNPQVKLAYSSPWTSAQTTIEVGPFTPNDQLGTCPSIWLFSTAAQGVGYFYNTPDEYIGGRGSSMTLAPVILSSFKTSIAASEDPGPVYKAKSTSGAYALVSIRSNTSNLKALNSLSIRSF